MTSFGAYDMGLPCKNTSCKSHGHAHPNCRCYGPGLADGGVVGKFCDSDQPHRPDCEYYAEGGVVGISPQIDPGHAVSGYLADRGFHGILKMHPDLDKYNKSINRGHKHLDSEIERVFENGRAKQENKSKEEDFIHDWISKGGITNDIQQEIYKQNSPQPFAEGGPVNKSPEGVLLNHPIETAHPEQNMLLNAIKGRVSNYLTSLRPMEHQSKLAFDDKPDNTEQERTYRKALKLAAHPVGILDKVQRGTIEPEHLKHMNAMYPEFNDILQKKITNQIIKYQLDDKKPHYKVRQGLSSLMGAPLSAEMTPQNIIAAQATFLGTKPQQSQGGSAPQKKTAPLDKASQPYRTADQAAASRQQKQ